MPGLTHQGQHVASSDYFRPARSAWPILPFGQPHFQLQRTNYCEMSHVSFEIRSTHTRRTQLRARKLTGAAGIILPNQRCEETRATVDEACLM